MKKHFTIFLLSMIWLGARSQQAQSPIQNQQSTDSLGEGRKTIESIFYNELGKGIKQPMAPDNRLWYYKNYLVEECTSPHELSYNKSSSGFYYDTTYLFTDFNTRQCEEHASFDPKSPITKQYPLSEKQRGFTGFAKEIIDSVNNPKYNNRLTDTSFNGQTYTRVQVEENTSNNMKVIFILYLTKEPSNSCLPIYKELEKKYNGTLAIMEAYTTDMKKGSSMSFDTQKGLTEKEREVFESWIKAGVRN